MSLFFCYITTPDSTVPHLQALSADTLDGAVHESRLALGNHTLPLGAEIFQGDQLVLRLDATGVPA